MLIMIMELYGMTILGYIISFSYSDTLLGILILGACVCALSSIIFIKMLGPKKEKKVDRSKECPYFIDKYDDMCNPEYIDRSM